MAKKRSSIRKSKKTRPQTPVLKPAFFGLSKSQMQSLSVGIIIVGLGLFVLATAAYKNRGAFLPKNMLVATTPIAVSTKTISLTPSVTPIKMISATSTAMLSQKTPPVKKLPNTSSKVTYTVEENDNLASIGKKLCGSDRAWLSIAATNNLFFPYIIHPKEQYTITCN